MAGVFHNLPGISFTVILFALVVVAKVDGTPYRLPGYFSYDDDSQPDKSFNHPGSTLPGSENHEDSANAATELKTIHYSESSASYAGGQGESRVFEISEEDRATKFNDHEHGTSRGFKKDATEDDDEDEDDADDDDSYANHDDNNNSTDITEDEITQLIEDALGDDIFLPPKKLAAWLGGSNVGTTSVKVQKTRSPTTAHSPVTQPTVERTTDHRIVFPDEYDRRRVPTCAGSTFCRDPENYLSDADIDNALNLRYLPPVSEPTTISERMGPVEDNGLCPSKSERLMPKTAISDDNEWYYVLNNEKYVQAVDVEICAKGINDNRCKLIDDFSSGYKTTCKQKYYYRHLVAVGPHKGDPPVLRSFKIPSNCCCHVQLVNDPNARRAVSPSESDEQSSFSTRTRN